MYSEFPFLSDAQGVTLGNSDTIKIDLICNADETLNLGAIAGILSLNNADGTKSPLGGIKIALNDTVNTAIATTYTADDGEFAFYYIADGIYTLIATAEGYTADTAITATITNGSISNVDMTMTIDSRTYSGTVSGIIRDETNNVVAGCFVGLYKVTTLADGTKRFPQFDDMMEAVDKVDSGNLTIEEVLNPKGWILIGFLMDPRTGLGRWRQFTVPNYKLMEELMKACHTMTTEQILNLQDVQERIEVYNEQTEKFKEMVKKYTRVEGNVIISDLRGVDPIYTGNRFMIYSMYPEQNISVWIVNGKGGIGCSAAVGYSILNRTSNIDVGHLMLKYNGGGHKQVGTCQFSDENMETELPKMLKELCDLANN